MLKLYFLNPSITLSLLCPPQVLHTHTNPPCSIALITLYCNSAFPCLSSLLDLAGWACLWAGILWAPHKRANAWEGLMGSLLWWLGISLHALLPSLVLIPASHPLLTSQGWNGRQMRHQMGKHAELLGEKRLCKPKSFFHWRNKANASKSSLLYHSCLHRSVGRREMAFGSIWMNHQATWKTSGETDSGVQLSRPVMRWRVPHMT